MKILFLTREIDVCTMIASKLSQSEYSCIVISDVLMFYDELLHKELVVDLIVCDYRFVEHEMFNIYQFLIERNKVVPLIFYNDPFPKDGERVLHWMIQNQNQYSRNDFEFLRPTFNKIAAIIEDPCVRPYISLIQPPLAISADDISDSQKNRAVDLKLLRRRDKMTPAIYSLFEFFYQHRDIDCSLCEIEKFMWHKNSRKIKHGGVYSYISRLRKCLQKDSLVKFDILRTSTGSYRMIVY